MAVAETIGPCLIGFSAALGLILLVRFMARFFKRRPHTRQQYSVVFAGFAVPFLAGAIFLGCVRLRWASALSFSMFATYVWAALGNWFEWPGFRPPPDPDEDEEDDNSLATQP